MKTPKQRVGREWKAHIPSLFQEILSNKHTGALRMPLKITLQLLRQVAARAIALDDPELNALMLRLALYEQGDPYSAEFDSDAIEKQYTKI